MVPLKIKPPENFFEEEIRCGYTVTSQMKEVWAVQLDLTVQLLEICKKHNINIFADAGTMLGAARHRGFIPWDDDMDFCMLRDEYDRFCRIAKEEFEDPYFFQTAYTDFGYFRGHAQLRNSETTGFLKNEMGKAGFNQGIFIDIFPLDEISEQKRLFIKQKNEALFLYKIVHILDNYLYRKEKNRIKYMIAKLIGTICPGNVWYGKYEHALAKNNGKDNKYVSALCLHMNDHKFLRRRKAYEKVIYLPFEYIEIPVSADYVDILTDIYGDWHEYVRGSSLHGRCFFDTSHSYRDYLNGKLKFH